MSKITKELKTEKLITNALKEVELIYNLSDKLSNKKIKTIKDNLEKIFLNHYQAKNKPTSNQCQ